MGVGSCLELPRDRAARLGVRVHGSKETLTFTGPLTFRFKGHSTFHPKPVKEDVTLGRMAEGAPLSRAAPAHFCLGFRVWSFGSWGLGFGTWDLGFRV